MTGATAGRGPSDRAGADDYAPCIDCGEEPGGCPEGRCRDCDIAHVYNRSSCRECGTFIMREAVAGPLAKQHRAGCSLAESDDWRPTPEST